MPLLDHFRPPVSARKAWEGFHSTWAVTIMQHLNASVLPKPYEAEPQIHLNSRIEVDVATLEPDDLPNPFDSQTDDRTGGVATAPQMYVAPAPSLTMNVVFGDPDSFEVLIYREAERWRLAAAIEIVSPANKDRVEHRVSFATKCASYLAAGASVVAIDLVTIRQANLHDEFIDRCQLPTDLRWRSPTGLAVVCYQATRPRDSNGVANAVRLDVWPHVLTLGESLPVVPLPLTSDLIVPLDLETTYRSACESLRLA